MPTFIPEDGTGLADANAYTTEAEADAYHDNYGQPVSWSGAAQADKEDAIRQSTQYLDGSYINRWRGFRGEKLQALDWPRRSVVDTDGWTRDSDAVPQEIKDACAIIALKVIDGDTLLPDVAAGLSGIKSERNKVGPIEEAITYFGAKGNFKRYSLVTAVLRPLLERRGAKERA